MRAHLNPTRMKSLTVLAERLAQRLATLCPGVQHARLRPHRDTYRTDLRGVWRTDRDGRR
jgi:hypothetical protein